MLEARSPPSPFPTSNSAEHSMSPLKIFLTLTVVVVAGPLSASAAAELHVGSEMISITPDEPVALSGQMRTRIAREVESPVTATALALESRDGDEVLEQAIFISCDLVAIRDGILARVREKLQERLDGFDA